MHQIENEFLRIKAREYGAELTSIFDKKSKTERLWNADPAFWGWHAPVLFPVVGRCLNDEITVDGKKYRMEKHGFARKSTFRLLELGDNKMIFSLLYNDATLDIYPFRFEFLIGYRLKENVLHVSYEVVNEDEKTMYFQLGGHPAFAVPPVGSGGERNGAYEDFYLQFEKPENSPRHYINSDGFFDGRKESLLQNSDKIALRKDLFDEDALILKDLQSRKVSLKSDVNPHYLSLQFTGFNYLGMWAKSGAPYVCIEPWLGCADSQNLEVELSRKEGVVALQPDVEFQTGFTVEIA